MFPVGEGIPLNRDSVAGRAILEAHTFKRSTNNRARHPNIPKVTGGRRNTATETTCSVPLLREGKAIGVITIRRTGAEPAERQNRSP